MSEEILELKIDADVSGAKQEVAELKDELKATKEEVKELNTSNKALNESNESLAKSVLDIAQNYTGMGGQIRRVRGLIGKLVPTFKNLFKTIKLGIASTGIGVLVIALGSIVTAMASTTKGGKAVKAIMNGIGEVVNFLIKPLQIAGDALLGLFGVDDAPAVDVVADMKGEIESLNQALGDIQLQQIKNKQANRENKEIVDDITQSEEVRLAALEEIYNLNKQTNADNLANYKNQLYLQTEVARKAKSAYDWHVAEGASTETLNNLKQIQVAEEGKLLNIKKQIANLEDAQFVAEDNYEKEITQVKSYNLDNQKTKELELEAIRKQAREERIAGEKKVNDIINKLTEELAISALKTDEEKELKKLEFQNKKAIEDIENSKADKKTKDAALLLLDEQYKEKQALIVKKYDDEEQAETDAEAEQLEKIRNENLIALEEDENEQARMKLEIQKAADIKAIEELTNRKELEKEIDEKYKRLEAEIDKKAKADQKERDQDLHDAKMGMAMDGMNLIQEIANFEADQAVAKDEEIERSATRGAKIAKAVALAQATISGTEGVINTFKSAADSTLASVIPGYQFIQAGLAAGFAAQNIRKIAAGEPPSDTGATGGVDTTPAPAMMGGAFTLGEAAAPEPVRAFVVTDEMTNSQNQLANIRRRATI
jgi:hypothetical protein